MRTQWTACLAITVFLAIVKVSGAQAATVNLNVLDDHIVAGENFDVEVWVDSEGLDTELLAFGFDVDTPGNYISYLGYVLGNGFDDLSDTFNFAEVSGIAFAGISDNEVLLATLNFSADSEGTDHLALDGIYGGLFYGFFYELGSFDLSEATDITISAVPIPASGVLLLTSLAFLALCSRERYKANRMA